MDLKIFTDNIEEQAKDQINLLLQQDAFKDCKIRIMPDVHAGAGCVIGFTGNLGNKVIPNIVGVDIGCGMLCINLGKIDLSLPELDDFIQKNIPSGFDVYEDNENSIFLKRFVESQYLKKLKCYKYLNHQDRLQLSLGTLGGGNHFIEIDEDDEGNKYLIIHTGSRNLGKQVAEYYQNVAIQHCSFEKEMQQEKNKTIQELKQLGRQQEISNALDQITKKYSGKTKLPKDLCYLEGKDREDYLHDMKLCQEFATKNRNKIAQHILSFLNLEQRYIHAFETIHNYIDDDNMIRKGAVSAKLHEPLLIPINMRDGCLLCVGKGNSDWNQSAPHGAGRIMSRAKARDSLNLTEFEDAMKNVYTTSVCLETIDESPMVYKPIEEIVNNIKDTVEIIKIIKPIYNFKSKNQ